MCVLHYSKQHSSTIPHQASHQRHKRTCSGRWLEERSNVMATLTVHQLKRRMQQCHGHYTIHQLKHRVKLRSWMTFRSSYFQSPVLSKCCHSHATRHVDRKSYLLLVQNLQNVVQIPNHNRLLSQHLFL